MNLAFLPEVTADIAGQPLTASGVSEASELVKREQPALFKSLDTSVLTSLALGLAIGGGCAHCVAMNAIALFYSRLKQQIETDALEGLAKLTNPHGEGKP